MSNLIDKAVDALNKRLDGAAFDDVAKFVLQGEGAIVIDANGARAGEDEAGVTLTATPEVFEQILAGELNPTSAFMSGKLSVEGNISAAMRLGGLLA